MLTSGWRSDPIGSELPNQILLLGVASYSSGSRVAPPQTPFLEPQELDTVCVCAVRPTLPQIWIRWWRPWSPLVLLLGCPWGLMKIFVPREASPPQSGPNRFQGWSVPLVGVVCPVLVLLWAV